MERNARYLGFPACVLALALAGCSGDDAAATPSPDGGSPEGPEGGSALDFTAFDQAVAAFVADKGLRGASAVLVEKERGIVHTAGYGEFTADRDYLVMSSSKILSVGILMRLADAGTLDVDAPIGDHVSAWGEGKPDLTLAQLVSGSSGLKGVVDDLAYAPYVCQFDPAATLTDCGRAIYTADDAADRAPADTAFHYGGAAWQLAGGVAEVASGKTWAELFAETYGPCDVPSMGFRNPSPLASLTPSAAGTFDIASVGYPATVDGDMSIVPETQNPLVEGGLFTNVTDYGKILLMHLRGGLCGEARVLSAAAVARMQVDHVLSYGGDTQDQMRVILTGADPATLEVGLEFSGYGMGWWVSRAEPGLFADPGAFGSNAWIDVGRGYAGLIAIEGKVVNSSEMITAGIKDAAEAIFTR